VSVGVGSARSKESHGGGSRLCTEKRERGVWTRCVLLVCVCEQKDTRGWGVCVFFGFVVWLLKSKKDE